MMYQVTYVGNHTCRTPLSPATAASTAASVVTDSPTTSLEMLGDVDVVMAAAEHCSQTPVPSILVGSTSAGEGSSTGECAGPTFRLEKKIGQLPSFEEETNKAAGNTESYQVPSGLMDDMFMDNDDIFPAHLDRRAS